MKNGILKNSARAQRPQDSYTLTAVVHPCGCSSQHKYECLFGWPSHGDGCKISVSRYQQFHV